MFRVGLDWIMRDGIRHESGQHSAKVYNWTKPERKLTCIVCLVQFYILGKKGDGHVMMGTGLWLVGWVLSPGNIQGNIRTGADL